LEKPDVSLSPDSSYLGDGGNRFLQNIATSVPDSRLNGVIIPEGSDPSHHCENLKSRIIIGISRLQKLIVKKSTDGRKEIG
jgi:hypothetical protein